jgi:hypothetical protein
LNSIQILLFLGWTKIESLDTFAVNDPLYACRIIYEINGAFGGTRIVRGNGSTGIKTTQVPLCSPVQNFAPYLFKINFNPYRPIKNEMIYDHIFLHLNE